MIEIRATTYGDGQVVRAVLGDLRVAARDLRPVFPQVLALIRMQLAGQFATEGARGTTGRWAALSPRYARAKARSYPGRGILVRTGALRDSLVSDGPGSIVETTAMSMFVSSSVASPRGFVYGAAHQAGVPSRGLPQRPIFAPTNRDAAEWVAAIWRYFAAQASRRTGRLQAA